MTGVPDPRQTLKNSFIHKIHKAVQRNGVHVPITCVYVSVFGTSGYTCKYIEGMYMHCVNACMSAYIYAYVSQRGLCTCEQVDVNRCIHNWVSHKWVHVCTHKCVFKCTCTVVFGFCISGDM